MKANAPERLYLSKTIYSTYLYQVPDHDDETAVEYVRTDAFIEKACFYIKDMVLDITYSNVDGKENYNIDEFIEEFEEYLKK